MKNYTITIEYTNQGLLLSSIKNNRYFKRLYIGYTKNTALKLFKKEMENEYINKKSINGARRSFRS